MHCKELRTLYVCHQEMEKVYTYIHMYVGTPGCVCVCVGPGSEVQNMSYLSRERGLRENAPAPAAVVLGCSFMTIVHIE